MQQYATKSEFDALAKRVANLEGKTPSLNQPHVAIDQSPREFLLEKSPNNAHDKCICLVYFLAMRRQNSSEPIGVKAVKKIFRDAREKIPTNVAACLARCAANGWITESDASESKKKYWDLTKTGAEYVETL